jgi:hypothetical protein
MTETEITPGSVAIPEWAIACLPREIRDERDAVQRLLRDPGDVLSPAALHTTVATRLSFANTLVDKMARERWTIELSSCAIAADGTGELIYAIGAATRVMSFAVQANPPMPVDRVSLFRDTETDYFAALFDGPFDAAAWEHEKAQFAAELWRGRAGDDVLGWTIARRGRAFEPTLQALAGGHQPGPELVLGSGGYLLRNGGYYGNGRMGTRAWASYALEGRPFESPYHVDLLTLYLWRLVSFTICEAAARARSELAVSLDPAIKRYLGVGNSSGLGTVAALIRWPERLSSFILPREIALAYARSRPAPVDDDAVSTVARLLARAAESYAHAADPGDDLVEPRSEVAAALGEISELVARLADDQAAFGELPWAELAARAAAAGSREAVELLHSFLIDAYPETDGLRELPSRAAARIHDIRPEMSVARLRTIIEERFDWVLSIDFSAQSARHFFWYRSEENGENRRGERSVDVGSENETFIDVAGAVRRLHDFLQSTAPETTVGEFLLGDPEHTLAVRRVQLSQDMPYSELRADICDEWFLASDGIRTFLSILGLEMAAPASRRWVRGVFYRGAPIPQDLVAGQARDWRFPTYRAGR